MSSAIFPSNKVFLNLENNSGVYRIIPVDIKKPFLSLKNIYVAKFGNSIYKLLDKDDYDICGRPELNKLWDETAGALSTLVSKDEMSYGKGKDYIFKSNASLIYGFVTDSISETANPIQSKIPTVLIFQSPDLEDKWKEFIGGYYENVENLYIPFLRREKVIQIDFNKNSTAISLDPVSDIEKERINSILYDDVDSKNLACEYLGVNSYSDNIAFNEARIRALKNECYKKLKELENAKIKLPF